jgi:light-harvesting complex I chlorophyll a/b binding protein 1
LIHLLSYNYTINNISTNIKMKLAIATLLAGSAAAFAPAQTSKTTSALQVSELELGVTEPLGLYDPLGWLQTQPETFERRRAVERKHGRIAMTAVVGVIVHNNHIVFDGYLSPSNNLKFSDVPTGTDGIRAIPTAGLAQILAFFALVELAWMPASKYDGDYGVGYFGTNVEDPEEKARKLNVELNNGRAAMMGIFGNMVAEQLTGQTMYEQYAAGHISPFGDGQGVF